MNKGFLPAEMFVVVGLAVLLFGGVVYYFLQGTPAARDNRRIADMKQIAHALALYFDANGNYPIGCEWSTEDCWSAFIGDSISSVPKDPVNMGGADCTKKPGCRVYRYCRQNGGSEYILAVNLERPRKQPLGNNSECSLGGPNQHWVTN